MIRVEELKEAIAECQGERNPNANTCIKLAAYYTILKEMTGEVEAPMYSQAGPPEQVRYDSGTEFAEAIQGKNAADVFAIIDELMDALHALSPKLYRATLERIRRIM